MKIEVTAEALKALAETAKQVGTTEKWMEITLEWINQADKEIVRLTQLLEKERRE